MFLVDLSVNQAGAECARLKRGLLPVRKQDGVCSCSDNHVTGESNAAGENEKLVSSWGISGMCWRFVVLGVVLVKLA